jgi:hypothetical protein
MDEDGHIFQRLLLCCGSRRPRTDLFFKLFVASLSFSSGVFGFLIYPRRSLGEEEIEELAEKVPVRTNISTKPRKAKQLEREQQQHRRRRSSLS